MKLSMETYVLREHFGDEAAIRMIKDAGFDAYDYSMYWASEPHEMLGDDYIERARLLRQYSDGLGISCNQTHAPFEVHAEDEFSVSNRKYLRLVRSLEISSILGAKNVIVHAVKVSGQTGESFDELNTRFYRSLLPYAEKFGVNISVENLFDWQNDRALPILSDPKEHQAFIKSLGSDRFNACLDIGHSAITGYRPEEAISEMSPDILATLHVHDNNYKYDEHLMPFSGDFDWGKIASALKHIGYRGELTFEIFGYLGRLSDQLLPDAVNYAARVGRDIISKIENGETVS